MVVVTDFADYREYLNAWIEDRGERSRGMQGKIAEACGISSTMVSLILKGQKQLSPEQATELADFIGLNDRETDFFLLLVELGRAGTFKLQQRLKRRIAESQREAKKISSRIKKDIDLSDEVKSVYYSSWIHSGIRLLSALEQYHDPQTIAERLNLPAKVVTKSLEFLLENNLCRRSGAKITHGPSRTHVDADSPFVVKHHQNWRLRGFTQMDQFDEANLFFTGPMALSVTAAEEIRKILPNVIDRVMKIAGPSASEKVCCLNLDWFEY